MNDLLREIDNIYRKELKYGLYDFEINNVPIWRLIRFNYRIKLLRSFDFVHKTKKNNYFAFLWNLSISLYQLIVLFIKQKKIKNLILSFPRLTKVKDEFIDKFTDPILECLEEDYIIFQRNNQGNNLKPRKNSDKVIYLDFIYFISYITSLLIFPITYFKNKKTLDSFFIQLNYLCSLTLNNKIKILLVITRQNIDEKIYLNIYKYLGIKNVLLVSREIYFNQIIPAKKNNIKIFELQHGITRTQTPYYTGHFQSSIDPDSFLVFGKEWINNYFGINPENIVNIGWGFNNLIRNNLHSKVSKKILVLSSPEITSKVIEFLIKVSMLEQVIELNLRLHPQEKLSLDEIKVINEIKNITLDDTSIDSAIAVSKHKHVIGQNSSVLFEALSLNKIVATFNTEELPSINIEDDIRHGFIPISSMDDLIHFYKTKKPNNTNNEYYSEFDKKLVNKLLK